MSAVFSRSLGAAAGGIFLIGHYLWTTENRGGPKIELYTGLFVFSVGAVGLLYWNWRRNKLRVK